jgi:hypothetical protein
LALCHAIIVAGFGGPYDVCGDQNMVREKGGQFLQLPLKEAAAKVMKIRPFDYCILSSPVIG